MEGVTPRRNGVRIDWDGRYEELKQYRSKFGDCNVPQKWGDNPQLGQWVNTQRQQYRLYKEGKDSCMTEERIKKLNDIGFEWVFNFSWDDRYEELKQYRSKFGDCNVPQKWGDNLQLGRWVQTQRCQYRLYKEGKASSMTEERIEKLNDVGFEWVLTFTWGDRYEEIKAYRSKYGDCNVPRGWSDNPQLGTWVNSQRYQYRLYKEGKQSTMTEEKIKKLNGIGFEWVLMVLTEWNDRYDELKAYRSKYGDCNVPQGWSDNPQLGRWVQTQRKHYRLFKEGGKSYMNKERIKKLNDIGFEWVLLVLTEWNDRYEELQQYRYKYGDCNVPVKWTDNTQLGVWVKRQREQYRLHKDGKESSMTEERIKKLNDIGFEWVLLVKGVRIDWDDRYEELKTYQSKYGDCNVPQRWSDNQPLGTWVSNQRKQYRLYKEGKESSMTEERIHLLNAIGIKWSLRASRKKRKCAG